MKLSSTEKKFYEGVFAKLEQNNQALDENNCFKLIERGVDDSSMCKKIWELSSQNHGKKILDKKDFFKMLKYIAAYQNGYQIETISVETLPELSRPNLPKKTEKEASKVLGSSGVTESQGASSKINSANNNNNEEKIASKENSANNSNNLLPAEADDSYKISKEKKGTKQASKAEDEVEEKKIIEKKAKTVEEKKMPEKRDRILEDLDSELIVPEQIKAVAIPSFDESVRIADTGALVNPFKKDTDNRQQIAEKKNLLLREGCNIETIIEGPNNVDNHREFGTGTGKEKKNGFVKYQSNVDLSEYNKYLEKLQRIKIEIADTMTHNSGFLGYGTYVTYSIKCEYADGHTFQAERRYSDFDWLNSYLRSQLQYKGLVFPKLPEKKSIGSNDPNFVHQRKIELEKFLNELGKHEILSQDPVLRIFLGDEDRENLQKVKERKPAAGIASLTDLDIHKVKDVYDYVVASMKIKLRKEDLNFDWKGSDENINEILQLDETINKLLKDLQKKEESYKAMQTIASNHNILHTKVMNRVSDESYYAIGTLSSLFVAKSSHSFRELAIVEDLIKEVKGLKAKLDGFKESNALLYSTLKEILTNKELNKNKQGKMFEIQAENNDNHMAQARKDIGEIENKIRELEKEAETIRDNLTYEMKQIFEEFEVIMPVALHEFYTRQAEQLEKAKESWTNTSSQ